MMDEQRDEPAVVEARGLTKIFRDFWHRPKVAAVQELSFDVRPGEVFGLLGPNGSGKSTTIKMILGLLHPTRGRLSVLGRAPREVKAKARIGYLPEESYLYPYLTSEETLDFYGRLFDLGRGERRERIEQLLEMIGLQHARRRTVGEFSKGMTRRIGLAQALINDPDVVVLDEPTSGLDPLGTRQVKDLIVTLARRGKTVLLCSHLLADVEDVCDRIAILYSGRMQAMGSINELLAETNRHLVNLPELEPAVLKQVLAALREALGSEPDISHPRRDLEQFFLGVVEKARAATREQSGVRHAEGLADYLSTGEGAGQGARRLEDLVVKGEPTEPAAPETPKPEPAPKPADDREADEKLKDLLPPSS
jgi:ABC-2 type transport system ATP-binding protein